MATVGVKGLKGVCLDKQRLLCESHKPVEH